MEKQNFDIVNLTSEELSLLDVMNSSYLTIEDVKWLKKKRWFKRFLKIYSKELKKRHKETNIEKEQLAFNPKKEDVEILDFTQSINLPPKEIIEILDFTKTINISDIKEVTKATEKAKKKIKKEKAIWTIITIFCFFVTTALFVILVNWGLENKKTDDVLDIITEASEIKEVITTTTENKENEITTTKNQALTDYERYGSMSILDVNFGNLLNINSDVKGWIKVNGTNINYPFVQASDNEYYLKHSFDKTSNKKGWVFLDFRNNMDNLDQNNILYAHGLVNNQMFGSMRKVIKSSWYKDKANHIIKIATPNRNLTWQVFSTYTVLPESYYIINNFSTDEEYQTFLNTIKSRSVYDYGVDLNTNDIILTLSSCYDNEKRMVLHAKLIGNEEKKK